MKTKKERMSFKSRKPASWHSSSRKSSTSSSSSRSSKGKGALQEKVRMEELLVEV